MHKSNDPYQAQIDELKSEIITNNSLLNQIETLLEKNTKNIDQKKIPTNNHNEVTQNDNNNSINPINNNFALVNRNILSNQIQNPNNYITANANFVNNPYMLMNNNVNGFLPNLNMNAMQINSNPFGVMMANNNYAAAYPNPYIANANNLNLGLNNQFLALNRF
jgi:hypothetical protein